MEAEFSFKKVLLLGTGYAIPVYMGLSSLYNESGRGTDLLVLLAVVLTVIYSILLLVVLVCVSFTSQVKDMPEGTLLGSYLIFMVHLLICLIVGSFTFG